LTLLPTKSVLRCGGQIKDSAGSAARVVSLQKLGDMSVKFLQAQQMMAAYL
jgi:hypothetical protein